MLILLFLCINTVARLQVWQDGYCMFVGVGTPHVITVHEYLDTVYDLPRTYPSLVEL